MNRLTLAATLLVLMHGGAAALAADTKVDLPRTETGAIAYLKAKGVRLTINDQGHAIRLMSSGKPAMTTDEYQLIGLLTHLEQAGINGAPLTEDQWAFLKKLPRLKRLAIWHGKGFATLKPFCGLPVESLTIGGCMGLRDKNKKEPKKQRDAILTLRDLPNLTHGNWYHSPLIPDDTHLAHIAKQFPKLQSLKLDFSAPRGSETSITPKGLESLTRLPLTTLSLENAQTFTAAHFETLAMIKTLEVLLIDARRNPVSEDAVEAFRKARPKVTVVVAPKGSTKPPTAPRKKKITKG